ncbi:MAG: hypothetical protein QW757_05350 [Candidatus Woesearchaeota archaeon]
MFLANKKEEINFPNLIKEILNFISNYYRLILTTNTSSFNSKIEDKTLENLLSQKPNFQNDEPTPIDLFPELYLALGSESSRIASSFLSNFSFSEREGLIQILKKFGQPLFLGEETGILTLNYESGMLYNVNESWLNLMQNNEPKILIFVDSIDGSKRMEEALHQGKKTLENSIKSLLNEKPEYKIITNSPSTGITIIYDNQIIFSIGLNLFTGEAIGSYYDGKKLIPFYITNILDFSNIADLQIPYFSSANGLNCLCYNGNKGYSNGDYKKNLENTGFSGLTISCGYPTGPLRIAYLSNNEAIVQISASNREKIHDIGNLLAIAIASEDLRVFISSQQTNPPITLINTEGKIYIAVLSKLEDPRNARATFATYHRNNHEADDFFNTLNQQKKGYFI